VAGEKSQQVLPLKTSGETRFKSVTLHPAVVFVPDWPTVTPSLLSFESEPGLTVKVWLNRLNCGGMYRIKALPVCRSADPMRCEALTVHDDQARLS